MNISKAALLLATTSCLSLFSSNHVCASSEEEKVISFASEPTFGIAKEENDKPARRSSSRTRGKSERKSRVSKKISPTEASSSSSPITQRKRSDSRSGRSKISKRTSPVEMSSSSSSSYTVPEKRVSPPKFDTFQRLAAIKDTRIDAIMNAYDTLNWAFSIVYRGEAPFCRRQLGDLQAGILTFEEAMNKDLGKLVEKAREYRNSPEERERLRGPLLLAQNAFNLGINAFASTSWYPLDLLRHNFIGQLYMRAFNVPGLKESEVKNLIDEVAGSFIRAKDALTAANEAIQSMDINRDLRIDERSLAKVDRALAKLRDSGLLDVQGRSSINLYLSSSHDTLQTMFDHVASSSTPVDVLISSSTSSPAVALEASSSATMAPAPARPPRRTLNSANPGQGTVADLIARFDSQHRS